MLSRGKDQSHTTAEIRRLGFRIAEEIRSKRTDRGSTDQNRLDKHPKLEQTRLYLDITAVYSGAMLSKTLLFIQRESVSKGTRINALNYSSLAPPLSLASLR